MREKIARLIAPTDFALCEKMADATGADLGTNNPMTAHAFEKSSAVLDALMEPSEAMIVAGTFRDDGADRTNAEGVFRAMIKAAKEGG